MSYQPNPSTLNFPSEVRLFRSPSIRRFAEAVSEEQLRAALHSKVSSCSPPLIMRRYTVLRPPLCVLCELLMLQHELRTHLSRFVTFRPIVFRPACGMRAPEVVRGWLFVVSAHGGGESWAARGRHSSSTHVRGYAF